MALVLNVSPVNPIHAKFLAIRADMNARFFEREEAIDLLLVGLLARKHVLFLGPPGAAKSDMARTLCEAIVPDQTGDESKFFEKQLTKGTTEDDLFGTPTLEGIKAGTNARCTDDTLLDARIALLSEIWKSNDAVLNALLYPLNERRFRNGRTMLHLPLEMLVGDSNELPDPEANLNALWDRFLLRSYVAYIKDPKNFESMWDGHDAPVQTIALSELKQAQAQAAQVNLSRVKPLVMNLKQTLEARNIVISDRRWKQIRSLLQAKAWMAGRAVAEADDLEILPAALWESKDQIAQIRTLILGIANPLDNEALNLRDKALEAYNAALQTIADRDNEQDPAKKAAAAVKVPQIGTNSIATMQQITEKLTALADQAIAGGKNPDRIQATLNDVIGWNTEVAKKCLGIKI